MVKTHDFSVKIPFASTGIIRKKLKDTIKEFLIIPVLFPQEMAYTYASEVDRLNMA